ncbi:MAG: hypothetical protein NVS9B15_21290 [Acidobacteriaceae bacterium]
MATYMSLAPNSVVGDYQVLSKIGAGGMGEVYKVRHLISDRMEAMKVLLPGRDQGQIPDRFLREVRVLASLQHPHIAGLHTAFRQDERVFMIMEFVEGETLRSKMRSSALNMADGVRYMIQVLSALSYAHSRGVVHRDIKPSNIVITGGDEAKLLDFGLALSRSDANLTVQGNILGSLHYMSPEQVRGEPADFRSDIYSTGMTLYELLTGKLAIDGPTDFAIISAHLDSTPLAPGVLNRAIPARVSDAVMRAIAKAPADRFASAAEFSRELEDALADDGPTMSLVTVMLPVRATGSASSGSSAAAKATPAPTSGSTTLDPAKLDSVSRELASFIGPIAKVVVKRAASRCTTLQELYASVAKEIESENDRKRFLAAKLK